MIACCFSNPNRYMCGYRREVHAAQVVWVGKNPPMTLGEWDRHFGCQVPLEAIERCECGHVMDIVTRPPQDSIVEWYDELRLAVVRD